MAESGNRGVLLAAIGAALLFAITAFAMRKPTPLGVDASPGVFSAGRAFENLKEMVGEGRPHPMGSAANAKVRDIIVGKLSSLGYAVELQSGWACNPGSGCGYPINIIATLKDASNGEPVRNDAVLLAAHYDSVAAGPGASDDGVGVASVIEIARLMTDASVFPASHPVVILISDGEEGGLLGARLFVHDHPLARKIKAAVNMDSRGTSGLSLMFETGSANSWLMNLYSRSVARPKTNSLYYVIYKLLPNNTDFSVFKDAGYQGFNFAFIGNVGFYHTPLDTLSNASLTTIQDQGGNAFQAVRALANAADLNPPISESVFFDVLAHSLVIWPSKAIFAVTLCLLVAACAVAGILLFRARVGGREIAWGLAGFVSNILLGATLSIAALGLLFALGKAPPFVAGPWLAHPAAMGVATVAVPVFAAGMISTWLARRAAFWGLWTAGIIGIGALSAIMAFLNPGLAFPWVVATIAALIGVMPALLTRKDQPIPRWATDFAALMPGLILLAMLLPMLQLLYQGLGAVSWPPTSIALCVAFSFSLPLIATASPRLRRVLLTYGGSIALAGFLITLALPTFSTQWPQRINVEYWLDADTGRAHWWVQPATLHLPTGMAAVAAFDSALHPRYQGINQMGFSAVAPAIASPAPRLELISISGSHREMRLISARGADKLFLVFPAGARVTELVLNTPVGPLPVRPVQLDGGFSLLAVRNVPEGGITIGIDSQGPFSASVLDESYGLPSDLPQAKALQSARPENATSSQDGDVTVLGRTVL